MESHRSCMVLSGQVCLKTSLISAFNGCQRIGGARFCCCSIRFWMGLIATETCGERSTDRYVGKIGRDSAIKRIFERTESTH